MSPRSKLTSSVGTTTATDSNSLTTEPAKVEVPSYLAQLVKIWKNSKQGSCLIVCRILKYLSFYSFTIAFDILCYNENHFIIAIISANCLFLKICNANHSQHNFYWKQKF